jgi:hypothetical protein
MNEIDAREQERQGAKNIALSLFRFRARRGIGVFYSLFSVIPLLAYYLQKVPVPQTASLVILGTATFLVWLASRMAGFRAFSQMTESIDLVITDEHERNGSSKKSFGVTGMRLLRILPFAALIVSLYLRYATFAELFLFVGVFDQLFYSILSYSRRYADAIVRVKAEDCVVMVAVVVFLVLSFIPSTGRMISFGYISPVFFLAGIKSLYEAPEEIVQTP